MTFLLVTESTPASSQNGKDYQQRKEYETAKKVPALTSKLTPQQQVWNKREKGQEGEHVKIEFDAPVVILGNVKSGKTRARKQIGIALGPNLAQCGE